MSPLPAALTCTALKPPRAGIKLGNKALVDLRDLDILVRK